MPLLWSLLCFSYPERIWGGDLVSGNITVPVEDCQVKRCVFSWLDSFVQWEGRCAVRQDPACCRIHLNDLTLAEPWYLCKSQIYNWNRAHCPPPRVAVSINENLDAHSFMQSLEGPPPGLEPSEWLLLPAPPRAGVADGAGRCCWLCEEELPVMCNPLETWRLFSA